jgi:hypothetical protein
MANVPTVSWSESTPAGSDNASAGDDRIRELKTQVREIINVDHDFPSSGQAADNGQHKQVTLQEQADLGTGAVGATILGSQTVSGKGELVYTDEDDNDIQITDGGKINAAALGGVYAVDDLAAVAAILEHVYPVGCVVTLGVSTNPGTLFGVGTWTAIKGKVIVGIADSGTFHTLDATGGAETVTLTSAQSGVPAHAHTVPSRTDNSGAGTDNIVVEGQSGGSASTVPVSANSAANASEAHTNLQPYIVKYCWQRVS